jgi:anti-sigma B factor antagonist
VTSQADRPRGRDYSVGAVSTVSEPADEPSAGGDADANVLALVGEIDMDTAASAFEAVNVAIQTGDRHIVLDLSGVEFLDSSGLRELVAAHHAALAKAIRLEIRAPSNPVRDVLVLTGLDVVFLPRKDPS